MRSRSGLPGSIDIRGSSALPVCVGRRKDPIRANAFRRCDCSRSISESKLVRGIPFERADGAESQNSGRLMSIPHITERDVAVTRIPPQSASTVCPHALPAFSPSHTRGTRTVLHPVNDTAVIKAIKMSAGILLDDTMTFSPVDNINSAPRLRAILQPGTKAGNAT